MRGGTIRPAILATLNNGNTTMRHYIIAAPNCTLSRNRSYYAKRGGITYVAQSESALNRLLFGPPIAANRCTIRAGLMRQIDNFRRNCRRIMRERNCNYTIAAAIYRHQLRTC